MITAANFRDMYASTHNPSSLMYSLCASSSPSLSVRNEIFAKEEKNANFQRGFLAALFHEKFEDFYEDNEEIVWEILKKYPELLTDDCRKKLRTFLAAEKSEADYEAINRKYFKGSL